MRVTVFESHLAKFIQELNVALSKVETTRHAHVQIQKIMEAFFADAAKTIRAEYDREAEWDKTVTAEHVRDDERAPGKNGPEPVDAQPDPTPCPPDPPF